MDEKCLGKFNLSLLEEIGRGQDGYVTFKKILSGASRPLSTTLDILYMEANGFVTREMDQGKSRYKLSQKGQDAIAHS